MGREREWGWKAEGSGWKGERGRVLGGIFYTPGCMILLVRKKMLVLYLSVCGKWVSVCLVGGTRAAREGDCGGGVREGGRRSSGGRVLVVVVAMTHTQTTLFLI